MLFRSGSTDREAHLFTANDTDGSIGPEIVQRVVEGIDDCSAVGFEGERRFFPDSSDPILLKGTVADDIFETVDDPILVLLLQLLLIEWGGGWVDPEGGKAVHDAVAVGHVEQLEEIDVVTI